MEIKWISIPTNLTPAAQLSFSFRFLGVELQLSIDFGHHIKLALVEISKDLVI